jgi:hypothetical protein
MPDNTEINFDAPATLRKWPSINNERHVPATHMLRSIDRFVDLSDVRSPLAPFYSSTGRPSIEQLPAAWRPNMRSKASVSIRSRPAWSIRRCIRMIRTSF